MESAKTKRVCLLKIYVLKYKWKCQYVKVMAYFIISVRKCDKCRHKTCGYACSLASIT